MPEGFRILPPYKPHGPCRDKECGHRECDVARTIALSPCSLCRRVIGFGNYVLDERLPEQREAGIHYTGYTHERCRDAVNRHERKMSRPRPRKSGNKRYGYRVDAAHRNTKSAAHAAKRDAMPKSAALRLRTRIAEERGAMPTPPAPFDATPAPPAPFDATPAPFDASTTNSEQSLD